MVIKSYYFPIVFDEKYHGIEILNVMDSNGLSLVIHIWMTMKSLYYRIPPPRKPAIVWALVIYGVADIMNSTSRERIVMNLVQHTFENMNIRSTTINDNPWFVAKDVCGELEIDNSRQALSRLDEDEKGVILNDTLGGAQAMSVINESGLYSLILSSRKPAAKKFKKWVTSEVLPSIRRTGKYGDFLQLPANIDCLGLSIEANNRAVGGEYVV